MSSCHILFRHSTRLQHDTNAHWRRLIEIYARLVVKSSRVQKQIEQEVFLFGRIICLIVWQSTQDDCPRPLVRKMPKNSEESLSATVDVDGVLIDCSVGQIFVKSNSVSYANLIFSKKKKKKE